MSLERKSPLLRQAMQEDSNLESDWLWYAARMDNDAEQLYCLGRALRINPNSTMASAQINVLHRRYGRASQATSANAAEALRRKSA